MPDRESEANAKMQKIFYRHELVDSAVYRLLFGLSNDKELAQLLKILARKEKKHSEMWKAHAKKEGMGSVPKIAWIYALGIAIARHMLGTAFAIKLLERRERESISDYKKALSYASDSTTRKRILHLIKAEEGHKVVLSGRVKKYEGRLHYIRSIIFGLDHGAVEVLAAVVGLAAFTASSTIVVIGGIIVAASGVFSIVGGAYLSSRSSKAIFNAVDAAGEHASTYEPTKEAYYTGISHIFGAILPLLPFLFGMSNYYTIAVAIVLTMAVLALVAVFVAILSDTPVRHQLFVMLSVSLGTALLSLLIGLLSRMYFGSAIGLV